MLGVSMYLTVDHLLASIELYGHMFDVHLLRLETGEMTVENKDVTCREKINSSCTIRYSGFLLFISDVTVAAIS